LAVDWDEVTHEDVRGMTVMELCRVALGQREALVLGSDTRARWEAGERYEMWLPERVVKAIVTRRAPPLPLDGALRRVAEVNREHNRGAEPRDLQGGSVQALLAYQELERRGWLECVGGGWFVTEAGGEHLEACERRRVNPDLLANGEVLV
jgi:hypothetical protein